MRRSPSAPLTAAIGLSLQKTLGNLFSGLAAQTERPFAVGDWVEIGESSRIAGRLTEINWHATEIQTSDRIELIVPHSPSKTRFRVVGRSFPDGCLTRSVACKVSALSTSLARSYASSHRLMSSVAAALTEFASTSRTLASFRDAALAFAQRALDVEVGLFATMSNEGMGLSSVGLSEIEAKIARHWDHYQQEIHPVQDAALRAGVSTDQRTLGRAIERTRLYREVMAEVGGTESLFLVPSFHGRKLGFLMLGRCGGRFSNAALAEARAFVPSLSVSCAALGATSHALDLRLSETERDLLSYLELGYSSRDIAAARGTSFYTVRNQLSTLYQRLGVANRTEAVGLMRGR